RNIRSCDRRRRAGDLGADQGVRRSGRQVRGDSLISSTRWAHSGNAISLGAIERRGCLASRASFVITVATTMLRVRCSPNIRLQPQAPGGFFMANIRVLATDLQFPEGPVVMPDGSVVLVEIRRQCLTRVYPDGRKEIVAQMPGGPNGAALGPDGKIYVCNNGGFTWVPTRNMIMPGPQPD